MVEAFLGNQFGFVQSTYQDQMATALAGDYFASDDNLIDSVMVNQSAGINIGLGVVGSFISGPLRAGVSNVQVSLPGTTNTAADFYGVIIRPTAAWTRSDGSGGYIPNQRMAPVLRPIRSGGRVWVYVADAVGVGDPVFWVIGNTVAGNARTIGSFTPYAIGADSVLLPNATFISNAAAGGIALMELLGTPSQNMYTAVSTLASAAQSSLASSSNSSYSSVASSSAASSASASLYSSAVSSVYSSQYSSSLASSVASSSYNSSAQSSSASSNRSSSSSNNSSSSSILESSANSGMSSQASSYSSDASSSIAAVSSTLSSVSSLLSSVSSY